MLLKSPFLFISLSVITAFGFADDLEYLCRDESDVTCSEAQVTLDASIGYFFFSDSKMRKVYDQGGFDVRVSGAFPVWEWLQVYGSVEYLQRHGRSINGHQKASIWEVPFSLGLKSVIPICENIQSYLTIGPRYFFVHAHNDSSYVDRNMSRNGFGAFANIGINYFPTCNFFVNAFGEYSYGRLHFHSSRCRSYGQTVQVGGFVFGAGLGYAF